MKTAYLFLTTYDDPATLERFRHTGGDGDKFLAYESRLGLDLPAAVPAWPFDLGAFGYSPLAERVVPGSTVLPLVKFLATHDYEQAWLVEDDVVFTGDWGSLSSLDEFDHDLLAVNLYIPAPWSRWFGSFSWPERARAGDFSFISSLLCVCRMSRRCAVALDALLREGFRGHSEILIPTLADYAGMPMTDLVTLGLLDPGVFRWQPQLLPEEIASAPRGLFLHPAKIPGRRRSGRSGSRE